MELIKLDTLPSQLPTDNELQTLVSNLRFSILPTGEAVKDYIVLNYDAIINSMDISENSKDVYKSNGKAFLDFLQLNDFNIDVYRNFKAYLSKLDNASIQTKSQRLITAKAILKNLHSHRHILSVDLTTGVKNFKTDTGHKKDGLEKGEVSQIKAHLNNIADSAKRSRLNCMFNLLTMQGLRQFEMCNILIEDYRAKDGTLLIINKGKEDKTLIDLHPNTTEAINEYLSITGKKSGHLFTSEKGTTKGEKLTERGFRKIFDSVFSDLNIDRTAHGFRHFFVSNMLEATNGNTGIVKQFSRHKSISALMMYDDRRIKKEHNEIYYKAFSNI
jgi:integrase